METISIHQIRKSPIEGAPAKVEKMDTDNSPDGVFNKLFKHIGIYPSGAGDYVQVKDTKERMYLYYIVTKRTNADGSKVYFVVQVDEVDLMVPHEITMRLLK